MIACMKAPLSWLKKYINLSKEPNEIAEILTLAGLEVEKIDREAFSFKGVVIAKLIEVKPHPDAEKLKLATVSDGKKSYQVVCGDTTIEPGLVVCLAKVGAKLTLRGKEAIEIKKTKLRGIESQGMFCSGNELGISDVSDQIYRLPEDAPLGEDLAQYLYDPTFDIALTPNLGHCRSIIGIARELSAHTDESITLPKVNIEEDLDNPAKAHIQVSNENHEGCFQYECRVIRGVQIKESPTWLKDWLEKTGHSIINNVVDITNFVMEETGQPLHAFDADALPEKHIKIRVSKEGENITTLDGEKRFLEDGTLLICDGESPIAIAGIMGGLDSGINENTNTVILEAAQFHPTLIRKTSKKLGLRSEASARFENQIDPANIRYALDRAASLIKEVAGGHILGGVVSQSPKPYMPRFITARLSRINRLLGTKFSLSEVETYLNRLGMTNSSDGEDIFQIKIPSYRNDIHNEIDIIEEVARVFGFNNIERQTPKHVTSKLPHHPLFLLEKEVRQRLVSKGLQEFLTCNLISPQQCDMELENGMMNEEYIHVMHAKSVDQSILRPSLLPGLLSSVKNNQNHSQFDIAAFEIGRIFFKGKERYDERSSLGIILSGKRSPNHWAGNQEEADFYDMKGIVEDLAALLGMPKLYVTNSSLATFHPGRQAALIVEKERIGVMGEVHPQSIDQLSIKGRVIFCEIDLQQVEKLRAKEFKYKSMPQYPSSERDLTFTMKKSQSLEKIFEKLDRIDIPLLKKSELLYIFEDEKIGVDNKNVTFRFTYRNDEKTLDVNEVEKAHEKVSKTIQKTI